MKHNKLFIVFIVFIGMIFTSCSKLKNNDVDKDATAYEKIHKKLMDLESYKSDAEVKYLSNKTENSYKTTQYAKISGEYRIEVLEPENAKGSTTIFDLKQISQFNKRIAEKITVSHTESMERSEIFLTSFIKNYFNSNEVTVSVAKVDDAKFTVLEANIPGGHPYLTSEKLWVSNDKFEPNKLVIYDGDGSERIIVNFTNFEYNPKLLDNIFQVN